MRFVRLLVIVFDVVCGNVFDADFFDVVLNVDVLTVFFANNLSSFLFCTASFCSSFSFLFLSLSNFLNIFSSSSCFFFSSFSRNTFKNC